MNKIYPDKLKHGDEVRIIAPASSLKLLTKRNISIANKYFQSIGLNLSFSKNVNEYDEFESSSIPSRVEDLHDAFSDKNVKAIIPVIGGYNCNQLLDYIDWDLIKRNPKIFAGFSDITALNNAIYAKTGLVNYSSPTYSTFAKMLDTEYTSEYFKKCLFFNDPIEIFPSKKWDDRRWWKNQKDRRFFRNKGWQVINEGEAEGTIIGANLCTLNLLQGTKYMPSLENSILFLEDDYESNARLFDRDLQSLLHLEGFDGVKGIVIGRFQNASKVSPKALEKIIKSKSKLHNIPVVAGVDFGHTDPKISFPVGGEVKINIKKENSKIVITKH